MKILNPKSPKIQISTQDWQDVENDFSAYHNETSPREVRLVDRRRASDRNIDKDVLMVTEQNGQIIRWVVAVEDASGIDLRDIETLNLA